jgi:predicted metal-dependent peptidase
MTGDEKTAAYGLPQSGDGNGQDEQSEQGSTSAAVAAAWQAISERMQVDLETFGKQRGINPGAMTQNLMAVNREKYDYSAFLKKFAVMGEAMKINDDEFDYIFYTYGLQLYEKMPLIEPLEYKEIKAIKEFVIAIDTSGSTSGELVQKFVQKTYNILKSTESFFSKINLHIIQCDADIQEDKRITCQEDFDEYLKMMQIRGLGGTDFRPVFEYVEQLRQNKEFKNLKGLIYFTDGYGEFPAKKPDYDTAFVFVDDEYGNPDVPPWGIKLILQKDEIWE